MSVLFRSTLHAESSDLADNIDVLSRSVAALEKGVSGSSFLQSHVGRAILTGKGSSQAHDRHHFCALETTRAQHQHSHKEGTDVHDVYCQSAVCPQTG